MVMTLVAALILGAALLTGLLIGVLQAATSIQEMTLSFIPKLAVMVLAIALFGEWQLGSNDGIFQFGLRESENDGSQAYGRFWPSNHRTIAAISLAHGQSVGLFSDGTIFWTCCN